MKKFGILVVVLTFALLVGVFTVNAQDWEKYSTIPFTVNDGVRDYTNSEALYWLDPLVEEVIGGVLVAQRADTIQDYWYNISFNKEYKDLAVYGTDYTTMTNAERAAVMSVNQLEYWKKYADPVVYDYYYTILQAVLKAQENQKYTIFFTLQEKDLNRFYNQASEYLSDVRTVLTEGNPGMGIAGRAVLPIDMGEWIQDYAAAYAAIDYAAAPVNTAAFPAQIWANVGAAGTTHGWANPVLPR